MECADADSPARLAVLAGQLDCFTEDDMLLLTQATPLTLKQWRKRGDGPSYIRAGNRYLYPRTAVSEWLQTRMKERRALDVRGVL